ncbi:hypothetical protein Z946_2850 [Sulfitobacter noctilucicola]|nr:hypothetical protein Z946_2850 [Sulfitobacter noctilucicola]
MSQISTSETFFDGKPVMARLMIIWPGKTGSMDHYRRMT